MLNIPTGPTTSSPQTSQKPVNAGKHDVVAATDYRRNVRISHAKTHGQVFRQIGCAKRFAGTPDYELDKYKRLRIFEGRFSHK